MIHLCIISIMQIQNILIEHCFTLFMAPPGFGKTTSLLKFLEDDSRQIVYLSPLRALKDEFQNRVNEFGDRVLVKTVETMSEREWEVIERCPESYVLVFDEFHLFYLWGETFRPKLLECFYRASMTGASLLALSATMNNEILRQVKNSLNHHFSNIYIIDLGNMQLSYTPNRYFLMKNKRVARIFLYQEIKKKEKILCFFEYRGEVKRMEKELEKRGVNVISCVGGEAKDFRQKLIKSNPDIILATSTLSHGVNLPTIRKIFFFYKIDDYDIWLQMAGRGGRDGKGFDVYSFNTEQLSGFQKYLSWCRTYLRYLFSYESVNESI